MKWKAIFMIVTAIFYLKAVQAQRTYWRIPADMFPEGKFKGITLQLGNGNKLVVYTYDAETIGSGNDFKEVLRSFFRNYDVIKDSVNDMASNKWTYYYNPGGRNGLNLISVKEPKGTLAVVDEKLFATKTGLDTIYIYPRKTGTTESAVFCFHVRQVEDLRAYTNTEIINGFIDNVDRQMKKTQASYKPDGRTARYYADGTFSSRFNGMFTLVNGRPEGQIQADRRRTVKVAYSVGASIQNYKNFFAPSFNASVDLYIKGVMHREFVRSALYWEPFFFFGRNDAGKLSTYRNDFVGLLYDYRRGSADPDKLSFYAPISIAYLVRRQGDFFERSTFNFGIGGIKYGAMTVRPFMYFNNFFRDVTPSVQLSVGWGR